METILLVFGVMLLLVAMMAIGVLMGGKPISGSCGGMSAIGMETACDVCGGDKAKCDTEIKKAKQANKSDLAYDASQK